MTVSDAYAVEGEEAGFIVKLNIEAPETINLNYTTRDGTALSGPDGSGDYEYTASNPPAFLEFMQGDDEKIVSVQTWTDDDDDPDENFFFDVGFDDPDQGTLNDPTGEGFITPYQTPTFSIERASADEGQPITVNVRRAGDLSSTSSVQYRTVDLATANRPATGGFPGCTACDYHTTEGTLEFRPNEDLQSFTVQTVADAISIGERPNEKFKAELFGPDKRHPNHGYSTADHQRRLHRPHRPRRAPADDHRHRLDRQRRRRVDRGRIRDLPGPL